jgi:deazaflavin-dependent oxidoreductase (nitroreductase family)
MRDRPSTWKRRLYRAPRVLFDAGLARAARRLGIPWILIRTRGRRSGREHAVVLDCLHAEPGRWYVQSAYGRDADWLRNVLADPRVRIETGNEQALGTASLLSSREASVVAAAIVAAHPIYARLVGAGLGARDLSREGLARFFADSFPTLRIQRDQEAASSGSAPGAAGSSS